MAPRAVRGDRWTPENELRLAQVWLAARSTYSVSLTL